MATLSKRTTKLFGEIYMIRNINGKNYIGKAQRSNYKDSPALKRHQERISRALKDVNHKENYS